MAIGIGAARRTSRSRTSTGRRSACPALRGKPVVGRVLPVRLQRHLHRRAVRDPRQPESSSPSTAPPCSPSRAIASSRTGRSPTRRATRFDILSDFWPHGAVSQAYGVFEEGAGAARRGDVPHRRRRNRAVERREPDRRGARLRSATRKRWPPSSEFLKFAARSGVMRFDNAAAAARDPRPWRLRFFVALG